MAGKTLHQLHASQSQGASLMGLFSTRPVINKAVTACVLMALLLVDQPLFQRGIRVVTRSQQKLERMTIPVSSSPLQKGATGIMPDQSNRFEPRLYNPLFSEVARQYQARQPIKLDGFQCNGRCAANIIAPGWDIACTESCRPYRLLNNSEPADQNLVTHGQNKTFNASEWIQTMFEVSTTYAYSDEFLADSYYVYYINISTLHKATMGGNGTLIQRNCLLSEALVHYPIEISGDTLTLGSMSQAENRTLQMVARSEEYTTQGNMPSTLGGIWRALESQYHAQAQMSLVGSWATIITNDSTSNTYLRSPSGNPLELESSNITWANPMDDIVSTAHELTLRAAVATTNRTAWPEWRGLTDMQYEVGYPNLSLVNRTLSQETEVTMSFTETVYETQPGWLASAFAVIGVACLSIIPTYWGWWHLGRPVSLSVLEIAKAFDAPLLRHADPNGSINEHLQLVGAARVRYGFGAHDGKREKEYITELEVARFDAASAIVLHSTNGAGNVSRDDRDTFERRGTISVRSEPIFDGQHPESPNEQGNVEEHDISPVPSESAIEDEGRGIEHPRGEEATGRRIVATTTLRPDTSNSSMPQAREANVQSHGVDWKLMFRVVGDDGQGSRELG